MSFDRGGFLSGLFRMERHAYGPPDAPLQAASPNYVGNSHRVFPLSPVNAGRRRDTTLQGIDDDEHGYEARANMWSPIGGIDRSPSRRLSRVHAVNTQRLNPRSGRENTRNARGPPAATTLEPQARRVTVSTGLPPALLEYQREKHVTFLEKKASSLKEENISLKEDNEELRHLLRGSEARCESWKQDFAEAFNRNSWLESDLQKEKEISDDLQFRIDDLLGVGKGPGASPKLPRRDLFAATESVNAAAPCHDHLAATEMMDRDSSIGARVHCDCWSSVPDGAQTTKHDRPPVTATDLFIQLKESQRELAESRKLKRASSSEDYDGKSRKEAKVEETAPSQASPCNIM